MLGSLVQDSKRKERHVKVLAAIRKPSGQVHALIENDKGERYRVTLRTNGTFQCRHEVDGGHEPCPSRHRKCYHCAAVLRIACLITEDGILEKHDAPREMQYYYHDDEVETAAVSGDKSYQQALSEAYEQLGKTKKVSSIEHELSACGLMRGQRHNYCGGQRIA